MLINWLGESLCFHRRKQSLSKSEVKKEPEVGQVYILSGKNGEHSSVYRLFGRVGKSAYSSVVRSVEDVHRLTCGVTY